jgi:FkbM family methyltransferase
MRPRKALKALLEVMGLDLIRYLPASSPLEVFDPIVSAQAMRSPEFFFVQVGANDGIRRDPLRSIVLAHHVAGLCVEPLPDMFERLRTNYASEPQVRFEQVAIAPKAGWLALYRFRADAPVDDYMHGWATFDGARLRVEARKLGLERYLEKVSVPAITFQDLLRKHQIGRVSLLQVDTEGMDHEIIKMALAAGIAPDMLHYEYVHMRHRERRDVLELLRAHGYRWVHERHDVFAMRGHNGL